MLPHITTQIYEQVFYTDADSGRSLDCDAVVLLR